MVQRTFGVVACLSVLLAGSSAVYAQGGGSSEVLLSSKQLASFVTFDSSRPAARGAGAPAAAPAQLREIIMTGVFGMSFDWLEGYQVFNASVFLDYYAFSEGWTPAPNRRPYGAETFGAQGAADAWTPSIIAGFTFLSGNGAQDIDVTGGLRLSRKQADNLRLYVQGAAGLTTGEGFTGFVISPGAGVILTSPDRPFHIAAGFDYRMAFYDGFTIKGPGFYGAVVVPLKTR
jgi:hypothetical protein